MRVEHSTKLSPTPQSPLLINNEATTSSSRSDDSMTLTGSPTPSPHQYTELSQLRTPGELDIDFSLETDELLRPGPSHMRNHGPKIWEVKASNMKLSALEATVGIKRGLFTFEDLEPYTPPSQETEDQGPSDPLSGALSAVAGTVGTVVQRVSDYPLLLSRVLESKDSDDRAREISEFAKDSEKGVSGLVGAGLKAPMSITHNVARGFNNLPKLYGDESVRPVERVTDVQSGVLAAGKGFGLGIWDGVSGLVTQPLKGAEEGGFMGGLVGLGKGIGGAVFKPVAGAIGVPGYALKGVYEGIQNTRDTGQEKRDLVEAQMIQGFKDWERCTEEDRNLIFLSLKREIEDLETMEG